MIDDVLDEIDLEADRAAEVGDLTEVIKLSERLKALYKEQENLEEMLKAKSEEIHLLESQTIPEAMDACRATQLPMLDGSTLKLKAITKVSLPSLGSIEKQKDPDKKKEMLGTLNEGLDWLRNPAIGGESLIKNFLTFEFDKGKDNVVGEFIEKADELGISHLRETTVNAATLEKFIKEKLEAGTPVPEKTFSLYRGRKAVIDKPKAKKESTKSKSK